MLIFIIFLFLNSILIYSTRKSSFFEVSKLFVFYWVIQILLISFVFINAYSFSGLGFLYITFACFVFLLSSSFGKSFTFHKPTLEVSKEFNLNRSNIILIFITLLAFLYPFIKIAHYGFGVQFLLNINSLLEMNNAIAEDRYSGEEINTLSDQILLVFTYLSPLYAGYVSTFSKSKKYRWLYYLVFIPTLLIALTQAMKLGFITSVFLWFSGKISSFHVLKKELPKLTLKNFFVLTIALMLFVGLLIFSMLLRTTDINSDTFRMISYRFVNYALGHLVAFDQWFSLNWNTYYPFELKTFYGISNLIGLGQRVQGVFDEFINYSNDKFPEEMGTNVFTFFRFVIEDFGIIGSLIFLSIIGVISGYIYKLIEKNYINTFNITIYCSLIFFVLFTFATSIWAYTSYIMVFLFFYFILYFSYSKKQ